MSDFFVMLVLKTVIYKSKFLDFQNFASLKLEHSESNTDFIDRYYLEFVYNIRINKFSLFYIKVTNRLKGWQPI